MHPYAVPAIYMHYINTQADAPIRRSSRKVHEPSTHSYSWREVKLDLKHFHSNTIIVFIQSHLIFNTIPDTRLTCIFALESIIA